MTDLRKALKTAVMGALLLAVSVGMAVPEATAKHGRSHRVRRMRTTTVVRRHGYPPVTVPAYGHGTRRRVRRGWTRTTRVTRVRGARRAPTSLDWDGDGVRNLRDRAPHNRYRH